MPNRFERTGAAGVVGTAGSTQRKARELTRIVADARGVGVDVLRPVCGGLAGEHGVELLLGLSEVGDVLRRDRHLRPASRPALGKDPPDPPGTLRVAMRR